MTYEFTFRPIDYGEWKEHKYSDKDWKIKWGDNWKIRQEKYDKYNKNENSRYYRIFKIEPVKENNKNYVFVAFPLFTNDYQWGLAVNHLSYGPIFCDNPQKDNLVENFAYKVSVDKTLKAEEVPYFCVSSPLPFKTKSVGETYYVTPDEHSSEKKCGISHDLANGVAEDSLILIAPPEGYKINQVDEQDRNQNTKKKPDKSNHQCQAVHDKLQDWEVKAKAKILADCQNDNHAGYYESGVFAAPEYTRYTVLTKKCSCGGELKKNNWGDEMTKCKNDCSGDTNNQNDSEDNSPDSPTNEPTNEPDEIPSENNDSQTIAQIQANAKNQIIKLLLENNLQASDLPAEFHQWGTDLEKLDSKAKIKEFVEKIEQAIKILKTRSPPKKSQNNGLSGPVKIAIGVIIIVFILGLGWWLGKFGKKKT